MTWRSSLVGFVLGVLIARYPSWTALLVFLSIVTMFTWVILTQPTGPRYDD